MTKKNSVLAVRVSDELYATICKIAEELHISVSLLVCQILTAFSDGYAARNK